MPTDIMSSMVDDKPPTWTQRLDVSRDDTTELLADVRRQAQTWRSAYEATNDLRADLNVAILNAKKAGHSFAQLRDATGLGIGSLQLLLAKMGYRED